MGNPHTVVALAELAELAATRLYTAPGVEPEPPNGTNVEFVVPAEPLVHDGVGSVTMRVHERGVGETQSCGTGACAAAVAIRHWAGAEAPDTWQRQRSRRRRGREVLRRAPAATNTWSSAAPPLLWRQGRFPDLQDPERLGRGFAGHA